MMIPIPQYPLYSATIVEYDMHEVSCRKILCSNLRIPIEQITPCHWMPEIISSCQQGEKIVVTLLDIKIHIFVTVCHSLSQFVIVCHSLSQFATQIICRSQAVIFTHLFSDVV